MYQPSVANLFTLAMIGLTLVMIQQRWVGNYDSNRPLLFYMLAVLYVRANEGHFNNYVIFIAIVAALFLRFEFLGGWLLRTVRLVEFVCLGLFLIQTVAILGFF